MPWGVAAAAVGAYGAIKSSKNNKEAAAEGATTKQELDPRAQAIIYGDGTSENPGLLKQYQELGKTPQNAGTSAFGNASAGWLGGQGGSILDQLQKGATGLMNNPTVAPQSTAAQSAGALSNAALSNAALSNAAQSTAAQSVAASAGDPRTYNVLNAQASQIQAPNQNGVDLTKSYNDIIYGDAGANPYLTKSLQAGVDLTNAGFNKNVNTLTDNLRRNVLPGIRSNSVLAGQYGSSRQGIAEGNALSDYTRQLNDANSVLAAQNSANTTGAQAAAYNAGKDRALSATQSLGGQQYGVAQQNAAMQQQTTMANVGAQNTAAAQNANAFNNQNQFNAGLQQQTGLANQSAQQQTGLANQSAQQQTGLANQSAQQQTGLANQSAQQQNGQFNAGLQQQTGLANQSAQLQTNGLNSTNQQAGLGALSGLLSNAYGYAQNQDNYAINRAGQINGILGPYLGAGGSTNTTQPYASNTAANILGGATAGLGLYNGIRNAYGTPNAQNVQPYQAGAQNVQPGTY